MQGIRRGRGAGSGTVSPSIWASSCRESEGAETDGEALRAKPGSWCLALRHAGGSAVD